jgi:hypothetical protein
VHSALPTTATGMRKTLPEAPEQEATEQSNPYGSEQAKPCSETNPHRENSPLPTVTDTGKTTACEARTSVKPYVHVTFCVSEGTVF